MPTYSQVGDERYNSSPQLNDEDSAEDSSFASDSNVDDHDSYQRPQRQGTSRKRKREIDTSDHQDVLYADALLDYFILCGSDARSFDLEYPLPPPGFPIDRRIDNQNHTALHWGAAMGDIAIVNTFLGLRADMRARNIRGETPILRAVIFTNNHAKGTMDQLVDIFQSTIQDQDDFGGTVFHHAAALTFSHTKKKCARYYLEILLSKLSESTITQQEFFNFVNLKDHKGDTALHIVARNDAKKCVQTLQGHGAASDIANGKGETVDQILHHSRRRRTDHYAFGSSSPLQPDLPLSNGDEFVTVPKPATVPSTSQYESQSAQSFRDSFSAMLPDKALQMVLDMEEGVHEKDTDHAESNRLLQNVTMELNQARQQIALLNDRNGDFEEDDDDQQLIEEAEALRATNESLLEQHQHKCLHKDVRAEEQNLPPSAHHDLTKSNGELPDEMELDRKVRAGQDLAQMQSQRILVAAGVVQAQATAGMSENGETYKRLISSTMGTSADEVSAMVPELLEVLEMSKMDAGVVRPAAAEDIAV